MSPAGSEWKASGVLNAGSDDGEAFFDGIIVIVRDKQLRRTGMAQRSLVIVHMPSWVSCILARHLVAPSTPVPVCR